MKPAQVLLLAGAAFFLSDRAHGQSASMSLPRSVTAGSSFSVATTGSGKAALYIAGPGGAVRREFALGETLPIAGSELYNAGHYLVVLSAGSAVQTGSLEVFPATQPASLSFLARPSRLPVGLRGGISGTVYVFDAYRNLITTPMPVTFQLSNAASPVQGRTVSTRNGVAWTQVDSAPREGAARFVAQVGSVLSTRVIDEVPGDPCGLAMSARPDGRRVALETAPVKDCSGNPVPDGTIVTFTESYGGMQSTVDAPLKQGVARAEMPSVEGARLSVASGVVAGNEIRWGGGR